MSEYEEMIRQINPSIHDVIDDIDNYKGVIFPSGVITENYETFLPEYQVKKVLEHLANPTLNENQQIVLEWLKEYSTINELIIMTADTLDHQFGIPDCDRAFEKAFNNLNEHEKRQVFSAWLIEQEGEG